MSAYTGHKDLYLLMYRSELAVSVELMHIPLYTSHTIVMDNNSKWL